MKKGQLFNAEICYTIAKLGHTDSITIGDAGLPIPDNTQRIDLALMQGVPSFLQVFDCLRADMQIEGVVLATEIKEKNPIMYQAIIARIKDIEAQQQTSVAIEFISHEQFKQRTTSSKAVIRTGECSPYANIILQSGVVF